jgi:hypothetical protein
MKSNLDKFFKNSAELEENGVWFDVSDGVGFLCRRFGGYNSEKVKKSLAKHYKPYAKQIELGTFPREKQLEIMFRVFVESCVIDWKGVEIDGKQEPFSVEACVKLFCSLPDLGDTIVEHASKSDVFREDLGNS